MTERYRHGQVVRIGEWRWSITSAAPGGWWPREIQSLDGTPGQKFTQFPSLQAWREWVATTTTKAPATRKQKQP